MRRTTLQTILVAGMVLLAGCAGGLSGSPTASPDGAGDGGDGGTGTVAFYISDQPNAIEDFAHLNVTISQIGFQQAGDDEADPDGMDQADTENDTERPDPKTEAGPADSDNESDATDLANGTDASSPAVETEPDDDEGAGSWIEHDVNNRTVDLTNLVGNNATMLAEFDVPNGTYTKVFVHVSAVEATLETGETVNVKLPSNKLQLNKQFEVGDGEAVDFVFDIAVHKAGKSGKYILRPVIGESGTDVPIDRVDDDAERANRLSATFVGEAAPGENVTVEVTRVGEPVANATVSVNGDSIGVTDSDGRLTFVVPDGEELEVKIRHGDAEAELEREFEVDDARQRAGTPTTTPAS